MRWKSDGARPGEYDGCGMTFKLNSLIAVFLMLVVEEGHYYGAKSLNDCGRITTQLTVNLSSDDYITWKQFTAHDSFVLPDTHQVPYFRAFARRFYLEALGMAMLYYSTNFSYVRSQTFIISLVASPNVVTIFYFEI